MPQHAQLIHRVVYSAWGASGVGTNLSEYQTDDLPNLYSKHVSPGSNNDNRTSQLHKLMSVGWPLNEQPLPASQNI
eukprot:3585883-Amphidinium_carterae.1